MNGRVSELADFLASASFLAEEWPVWDNIPLHLTYYHTTREPPAQYVSSVRTIVFQNDSLLVIRDKGHGLKGHELYIMPGGRCEKGESSEQTLRREVLEETGWAVRDIRPLGCMYFHHLGQKPEGYSFPYPDFIWPIYISEADMYNPEAIEDDDYVLDSKFCAIEEVQSLKITEGQLELLKAALEVRERSKLA